MDKAIPTPGVVKIIGFGGKPAKIDEEEINALQLLTQSHLLSEPWKYLPDKTPVLVETGPLAGTRGFICNEGDGRRPIISITLLQRSVAIQIDERTVVSVASSPRRDRSRTGSEAGLAVALVRKV